MRELKSDNLLDLFEAFSSSESSEAACCFHLPVPCIFCFSSKISASKDSSIRGRLEARFSTAGIGGRLRGVNTKQDEFGSIVLSIGGDTLKNFTI
jgi:hypothetical protein